MSIDRVSAYQTAGGMPELKTPAKKQGEVKESKTDSVKDQVSIKGEGEKPYQKLSTGVCSRQGSPEESKSQDAPDKKKWTVLAYINGKDGNLQRLAPSVMRELEAAGSDENLNIVAQLSRQSFVTDRFSKDWSGTKRYVVQRNMDPPGMQEEMMNWFIPPYTKNIISPVVEDLGDKVDSADPATIKDFLQWGIKQYPADHYAIIFYGQGGGFAGSLSDSQHKSVLDNKELADVLSDAAETAGKKIDLVAFDGNLMSQLEVADQIKDSADIMVASEGTVNLGSLPLDSIVKNLKFELADSGHVTPEEFAKFFVFEQKYQPGPAAEMLAPTLSAIDLRKIGDLKTAFGEFSGELLKAIKINPELKTALAENIKETQAFVPKDAPKPYSDYRDIGHFTKLILEDDRFNNYYFPNMEKAGQKLLNSIDAALIDESHIGKAVENAAGISAYMPTDFGFDLPPTFFQPKNWDPTHGYGETGVAADTVWEDVLKVISKDTKFKEQLRNMGISESVINKLDKTGKGGKALAKRALGFASNAGYYQSYKAMRGKPPESYFKIPGDAAVKIGIAGGAYSSYKGAKQTVDAIKDDELKNRKNAIVDGVADSISGAAVTAACIGMSVAAAAKIATPAGYVSVAVPIAKAVYNVYTNMKQQSAAKADKEAENLSPKAKLEQLEMDKFSAKAEEGRTYISPIIRWLMETGSSGPVNPKTLQK